MWKLLQLVLARIPVEAAEVFLTAYIDQFPAEDPSASQDQSTRPGGARGDYMRRVRLTFV